ncbi:MAG: hypothetical protein EHM48_03505 [Planctomycetaceae bacterium]|nr:MAG: hypothetical protein EHM48_03505 [Planctomycetaceae bacterium]
MRLYWASLLYDPYRFGCGFGGGCGRRGEGLAGFGGGQGGCEVGVFGLAHQVLEFLFGQPQHRTGGKQDVSAFVVVV